MQEVGFFLVFLVQSSENYRGLDGRQYVSVTMQSIVSMLVACDTKINYRCCRITKTGLYSFLNSLVCVHVVSLCLNCAVVFIVIIVREIYLWL